MAKQKIEKKNSRRKLLNQNNQNLQIPSKSLTPSPALLVQPEDRHSYSIIHKCLFADEKCPIL